MRWDRGFVLVELLVALVVTLAIAGLVLTLVNQAQTTSQIQPDAVDMQQRARVGTDVLLHDLVMAGAGPSAGPLAGSLVLNGVVAVMPRRLGLQNADASTVTRADAITLMFVTFGAAQTTVKSPFGGLPGDLVVNSLPSCDPAAAACGFASGMTGVLFDATGRFDIFSVTQSAADTTRAQLLGLASSGGYQPGDGVAEVELHTYYLDTVSRQLRHYDGNVTDVPVVDDVVALSFAYFGEPRVPDRPKPPLGVENCLYDATGAAKPLPQLTADGGSLAPLPLAMFTDGPWCGTGPNTFDVDLLRIRAIRVTLRVQAVPDAFRATGVSFLRPGFSRASSRWLADYVMTFDVAPRNLNVAR